MLRSRHDHTGEILQWNKAYYWREISVILNFSYHNLILTLVCKRCEYENYNPDRNCAHDLQFYAKSDGALPVGFLMVVWLKTVNKST